MSKDKDDVSEEKIGKKKEKKSKAINACHQHARKARACVPTSW